MKSPLKKTIKPLNREPVSVFIMNMIMDYLLKRELKPGDKLPTEPEFAQQLGVGRNSVREATKMLSSLGVIEVKRGVGTFISRSVIASALNPLILSLAFEQGTSENLIELRLLLDTGVAELVMQKVNDKDIEKAEKANLRLKKAAKLKLKDPKELKDLDLKFHLSLLELTRNDLIIKIGKVIYTLFTASIEKSVKEDPYMAYERHQLIIDAIKKRDSHLIRNSMNESLAFWMEMLDS